MNARRNRANKNKRKLAAALTFFIVLVLVSVLGIKLYMDRLLNTDTFYEGITIDGLSMDGLTKESAEKSLRKLNQPRLDKLDIELKYESNTWTFGHEDIQDYIDIAEKVDEAYSVAREGTFLDRFLAVQKLKRQGRTFNTELTYNVDRLKEKIEEIASAINSDPVDATLKFNPDDKIMFNISPEKYGLFLDVDTVIDQIREILNSGTVARPLVLSPVKLPPGVLARDFEGKLEKITSFSTDLSKSSEDRTKNVVTAALAFNGLVVSPGQTISFNETTGKRTADKGYGYAPMIQNKRFVNVLGGGVSQTSTTLYNTVIRAGLDVVERTRHSIPSSYIDMGLDTTVNLPPPEPVIDLKFRNNRESPIYIRAYYADKRVYFEVYGEPLPDGQRYEFHSEVYETVPAPSPDIIKDYEGKYVEYEGEEYVHTASRNGYKVRVYRQTFQKDKLIKEELFDTHYYRPVKGKTYIGIKKLEDTSL